MIYKKSVVLTGVDGGKEKAVVSLEYDGGEMLGNVRLYNFDKEPNGILSLGILCGNEVLKAGLTRENGSFYTFKLNGAKELNSFSCALVNFDKGEAKPLLLGSTNGISASEENICNSMSIFESEPKVDNIKNTLDQNGVFLEDQEEIDELSQKVVNDFDCENKCTECMYRDAFFKLEDDTGPKPEEPEETFFDGVKEQIETLFNKYPAEEILAEIIPDSKWVKIDNDQKGEYYVVGLLYEDNKIKYICYGVPSVYADAPPEELAGFSQWLPIDSSKEQGFGYWITYQDAETGENVKVDFETV